jgi:glycerol-3-phosphate dehydrogenase (NAD+)
MPSVSSPRLNSAGRGGSGESPGSGLKKVAIIGSGNWGSTAAKLCGENCARPGAAFEREVTMWVFEEDVGGRKLSEIINTEHENVKYLKGVKLPDNVRAEADLAKACAGASVLVFVVPHQFIGKLLPVVKQAMAPDAFAISLIKGIDFDEHGMVLLSDVIRAQLGIDVCVLMGANVADEIAREDFAEATIGGTARLARRFQQLFQRPYFRVNTVECAHAVELCGALKNVVALGAGFSDGLGWGNNTKAAIIRIGLDEMRRVIELYYGNCPPDVLLDSCGVADLITTCYGGRNRKCAEHFVRSPGKSWEQIEKELLNGQSLQGTLTSLELHKVLTASRVDFESDFPLFNNIHKIAFQGAPASSLVDGLTSGTLRRRGSLDLGGALAGQLAAAPPPAPAGAGAATQAEAGAATTAAAAPAAKATGLWKMVRKH